MFDAYINSFVPLSILIAIGYVSKKKGLFSQEAIKPFNKIIITFALPCLVFTKLYDASDSFFSNIPNLVFIGLIGGFATGLVTFLIFRKYSYTKKFSLILPVMMGQTAFMGYPIVLGTWGNEGLVTAILYDISTYIIFSILKIILTINSKDKSNHIESKNINSKAEYTQIKDKIKQIIKSIISLPILWAIFFGIIFALSNIKLNEYLSPFKFLADLTSPMVMILLGLTLDFNGIRENFKIATVVSLIKLVLFPLVTFIMANLLNLSSNMPSITVVEAAMPCALISLSLGIDHDMDYKLISDCIILSTIYSMITIFVLLSIIPT
jgi:predicted permease